MARRALGLRSPVRARDLRAGAGGGGGGGGGFAPTDIEGCEWWLDATDEATISGTASLVDGWTDKSAAGNDVAASGVQRPSQVTINSLNAIRFDANERLTLASAGVTGLDGADMSVFAVFNKQFDEADSWPGFINRSDGGWSNGWRLATGDAGGSILYFSASSYTSNRVLITSTATGADAFALAHASHTNTGPSMIGYLNNVQTGTDNSGDPTGAASQNLSVGVADNGTTYTMFGSIGEIIVYNSVLSTEDRLTVATYLADKWGITLP